MKQIRTSLLLSILLLFGCSCLKEVPSGEPKEFEPDAINVQNCEGATYTDWETSEYVLPYTVGETYTVNLSHCSGSYHSAGQPDQFAIDFAMGIGSQVTASRNGNVVFIEESGFDGGFPNNLVVVQHSDGTYAQYMHLTNEGAAVAVGQNISKGDVIGYSGSTGLAGYPHLHFVATKGSNWAYPYQSFPTTFSNTTSNEFSLESGMSYMALPYNN